MAVMARPLSEAEAKPDLDDMLPFADFQHRRKIDSGLSYKIFFTAPNSWVCCELCVRINFDFVSVVVPSVLDSEKQSMPQCKQVIERVPSNFVPSFLHVEHRMDAVCP